jgi:hypothetical protein
MAEAPELVIDLIFGRWRSQILHAGVALGVFDHLAEDRATGAAALAPQIRADSALLYRLLRALATIGLLAEDDRSSFRLTEAGALLREDHPHSLRAMALLEEGAGALCDLEAPRCHGPRRSAERLRARIRRDVL